MNKKSLLNGGKIDHSKFPTLVKKGLLKVDGCTFIDGCDRPIYEGNESERGASKHQLCEQHYYNKLKMVLNRQMKLIYKTVDSAFADMDFRGRGEVSLDDFFKAFQLIKFKVPYTEQ